MSVLPVTGFFAQLAPRAARPIRAVTSNGCVILIGGLVRFRACAGFITTIEIVDKEFHARGSASASKAEGAVRRPRGRSAKCRDAPQRAPIPYFFRNLSTRPPVSTIFCLPV